MSIFDVLPNWKDLTPEQRWSRVRSLHPEAVRMAGETTGEERARWQERADVLYDAALVVSEPVKAWRESDWWRDGGLT